MDVSINLISHDAIFQPLADISAPDFAASVGKVLTAQLITRRAGQGGFRRPGPHGAGYFFQLTEACVLAEAHPFRFNWMI